MAVRVHPATTAGKIVKKTWSGAVYDMKQLKSYTPEKPAHILIIAQAGSSSIPGE